MRCTYALTVAVLLFAATAATAQPTPQQARAIAERSVVTVELRDGTWRGRITELTADSVTIQPEGWPAKTLPLAAVLRIDAKTQDSVGDGAVAGAVVTGLWCLLVCGQGLSNGSDLGFTVLMNAVVGAGIGAAIDASHTGRTTLYKRPAAQPRKPGVFFTVRF